MNTTEPALSSALVDEIPVIWIHPGESTDPPRLAIWLPGLGGTKEQMQEYLVALATAGFVALSFDPWQHGERGREPADALQARVFDNFRRYMWPILGQSVLDTVRVIDWAVEWFSARLDVCMGGTSMGGDIAVAAAGLDHRIASIAAIIATADWLRPGMRAFPDLTEVLPPGQPDAYARFFYECFNPLTHLAAYAHGPAITFECGADDVHVPPDGALRFQAGLRDAYPDIGERIRVVLHPDTGHEVTAALWENCVQWFLQSASVHHTGRDVERYHE